jgi:hypothetical protein
MVRGSADFQMGPYPVGEVGALFFAVWSRAARELAETL